MNWREELASWPLPMVEFEVVPSKTALLIVDMQYCCAHPDYGLGRELQRDHPELAAYYLPRVTDIVVPNIRKLISFFRESGLRIVYLTVGSELPDGSDLSQLIKRRQAPRLSLGRQSTIFRKGTFEHSIVEELEPEEDELVINKTSFGAFNSTNLDGVLRNMGIESLIITGVGTDVCVETTARDAADRGYSCVLVEDACATLEQSSHEATLLAFAKFFGGMVRNTEEVIDELSG
jgi:nicotinamidase-related amidase